jgi:ferric-dicitrate binding protein FerR (iron transport regulator)
MSNPGELDGNLDVSELWTTLQELEEGTLTPDQRDELMACLEHSRAARRAYFEYFQQAALFKTEAARLEEAGRLPVIDTPSGTRRTLQKSVLAAAAVLILAALVAALIVINQPPARVLTAAHAADTQWSVDGEEIDPNSNGWTVKEGSTVQVLSGTVQLTLPSQTTLIVQGPAHVAFPKLEEPVLKRGWLWVDSSADEDSFTVRTPNLRIKDIGTRFGVRVPAKAASEVHLVEGKVEVYSRKTNQLLSSLTPKGMSWSFPAAGKPTAATLSRDPFPAMPKLLAAAANYRTTILSQGPQAYWPLDDVIIGDIANEVAEGPMGRHGFEVILAAEGVQPDLGFHGFDQNNLSVYLGSGSPEKSLLHSLIGPEGVSKKEGSIAFWIQRPPIPEQGEVLWFAGKPTARGLGPIDSMHAHLAPSGRIKFYMENGKYDVLLSSTRSVADGRWHAIVATWDEESVDLYVDGRRVARDDEVRGMQDGVFHGRDVRFGKTASSPGFRRLGQFHGWVDEIALWDRALTPAEVHHQFRAAQGTPPGEATD